MNIPARNSIPGYGNYAFPLDNEQTGLMKMVSYKKIRSFTGTDFYIITAKYARYHTLISTSTPLGNSNFIRASTVLEEEE